MDERDVGVRDLRAEAGDEVIGVARRELLRDKQVHAVGSALDLLVDPGELGVEFCWRVNGRREDAEAAGVGDGGDDAWRTVEADDRVLYPDELGERGSHQCSSFLVQVTTASRASTVAPSAQRVDFQ
jgi:hypothetical protein